MTDAPALICQCGYDLRGLADDANCPECALGIESTRARIAYGTATARRVTVAAIAILVLMLLEFTPAIASLVPGGGDLIWTFAHLDIYLGPILLAVVAILGARAGRDPRLTLAAALIGAAYLVNALTLVFPTPFTTFIYRVYGLLLIWRLIGVGLTIALVLLVGFALARWAIRLGRRGLGESGWMVAVLLAAIIGLMQTQLLAWVMLDTSFTSGLALSGDPPPNAARMTLGMFIVVGVLAGAAAVTVWRRRDDWRAHGPSPKPLLAVLMLTPLWLAALIIRPEAFGAMGTPYQILGMLRFAIILVMVPWLIAYLRAAQRARRGLP